MITEKDPEARAAHPAGKMFRRMLAVLFALVVLAVGVNLAWWFNRPALEPLPNIDTEHLEPEVRNLISQAAGNIATDTSSASAWGDLGAVYFVHNFEVPSQACLRNAERLDARD